jgi:predicted GTPase
MGIYLIELDSGRLRVGATAYREMLQRHGINTELLPPGVVLPKLDQASRPKEKKDEKAAEDVSRVTLALVGQVKAGKSSLINGLLGEQRAVTDVLPATDDISRYELQPAGVNSRLVLLDTVGYGHSGPREDQLKMTRTAAQQSDVLLLVLHAKNPGRQADLTLLKGLTEWFASHPELKRPPIVAVMTHIDLLSPTLEWSPPYDWQKPRRPKEKQIREALLAVQEQLGPYLSGVIPVCVAGGKVYGVEEWLLPAISKVLEEGRAVAMLRALRAEVDRNKVRKVFEQTLAAGQQLLLALLEPQQ